MTAVVYSQLGELLRTRRLTVADLARQLRRRFGLTVNAKTLYRLTGPGPIRHANLAVTIATAAVLGVALEDLFLMRTLPDDGDNTAPVLDPAASRRLAELFDRRASRTLTAGERDELDRLVLDYSGLARDRELRRFADEHGLSIEQARDRVREQVGDIVAREHATYPATAPPVLMRWAVSAVSGSPPAVLRPAQLSRPCRAASGISAHNVATTDGSSWGRAWRDICVSQKRSSIAISGDRMVTRSQRPDHPCLFDIAAGHRGYFTAAQARTRGFSSRLLAHHVASGRYERVRWGLYRLRAYPTGPHDEVMAAWLAVGKELAVVSHDSALDLLELSDVIPDSVHLTVPRARRKFRPLPGTTIHTTTRTFSPGDLTEREGIRLTGPARTILDAAEIGVGPEQIELAIRQAAERGWVDLRALRRDGLARGGRVARLIAQGAEEARIAQLAARLVVEESRPLAERLHGALRRHGIDPLSPEARDLGRAIIEKGDNHRRDR